MEKSGAVLFAVLPSISIILNVLVASIVDNICTIYLYHVLTDMVSGNLTGNPKVSAAKILGRLNL